ncbi:hypothetical protein ACFVXC_03300 [Streptomyces sp. NPDC058257]|uniref:hypothetical protein n=1 Tax=Streptomyces sp. NPDC058257 TaxID=3346409 RepID=UPI0036F06E7A
MDAALTAAAFLLLITVAAYVIRSLNTHHAESIALHTYSRALPSGRAPASPSSGGAPRLPAPPADRHDHRDGGRGRFGARRRRDRTTHKQAC